MFRHLLDRLRKGRPLTDVGLLTAALEVAPADQDMSGLVPIIVPEELLDCGNWPGPIERIGQLPFALAWALWSRPHIFVYVSHEHVSIWKADDIAWQRLAFENLHRMSVDGPRSARKLDSDGQPFIQVLLHEDSLGPSRLLLPNHFDEVFEGDYLTAIPERTCAVLYRRRLSAADAAVVEGMIMGCYEHGTEPMRPDRIRPEDFWGPATRYGFRAN